MKTILKRLADAEDKGHLSLDSSRIVDVIKGSKVGQGLKFLPRKLKDLVKCLQIWLEKLTETGRSDARNSKNF